MVEDSAADAALVSDQLRRLQFQKIVIVRDNSELTKQLALPEEFDLIICDLMIPGVDRSNPLDSFDAIHDRYGEVPKIVITGLHDNELAADAIRHGADEFVAKIPGWQEAIAEVVRHAFVVAASLAWMIKH